MLRYKSNTVIDIHANVFNTIIIVKLVYKNTKVRNFLAYLYQFLLDNHQLFHQILHLAPATTTSVCDPLGYSSLFPGAGPLQLLYPPYFITLVHGG